MRAVGVLAAACLLSVTPLAKLLAQTNAPIAFDVVSIRALASQTRFSIGPPVNGRVDSRGIEVLRLIQYAYGIDPIGHHPVPEGGPPWIRRDLYEIAAQGPRDITYAQARRAMLTVLQDRFKLQTHIEQREFPVYALVPARKDGTLGPNLRPANVDCRAYADTLARTGRLAAAREVSTECQLVSGGGVGVGRLQLKGTATMGEILRTIARSPDVDRPVFDRTGLTGTYEVDMVWAPQAGRPLPPALGDVLSIFTALQEQLGLRLEPRREALDVVVIDAIERPTPN